MLAKRTDLDNPECVKSYIARQDGWSNAYKECMVNAYVHYARMYNISWEKPIYKRSLRLPNVPSTEQVNKIIVKSGRKYSLVFSLLRDTGLRPIELHRLTLRNLDLERGLVYPSSAKGGRPRVLKLKTATLAMLKEYITKNNFLILEL